MKRAHPSWSFLVASSSALAGCSGQLGGGQGLDASSDGALVADSSLLDSSASEGGVSDGGSVLDADGPVDGRIAEDATTDSAVSAVIPTLDFTGGPVSVTSVPSNVASRSSVPLVATVVDSPASITLTWMSVTGRSTSGIEVFRKSADSMSWGSAVATPASTASSWTDSSVTAGTLYEYRVRMMTSEGVANGYISSGIDLPSVEDRGRLILLVETEIESALRAELAQLSEDLASDGWRVMAHSLSRTAGVTEAKALIEADYDEDPARTPVVFLLGHIAVPYSGNAAPDGHGEHTGAWPADGYYADMDGTWTDTSVTASNGNNVPGDGRFDQSNFPSRLELEVGRVDMNTMDAFRASGETDEIGVYRRYLQRLHAYRSGRERPLSRALVVDNFDYADGSGGGYGFPAAAYRGFYGLVGSSNVTVYATKPSEGGYSPYFRTVDGQSYLFTYASGGGGYTQASGIGNTWDFASVATGGVFNVAFGSYFGDFDNNNNFLRAFIAGGAGLSSVWSGSRHWHFHRMAMGERIGTSHRLATNNSVDRIYETVGGGCCSDTTVHMALMGDPTLRLYPIASPASVTVSNASGSPRVSWTASTDAVGGYHVYELTSSGLSRLTSTPVTETSYTARGPYASGRKYAVRGIAKIRSPAGTYVDLSVGAVATAP